MDRNLIALVFLDENPINLNAIMHLVNDLAEPIQEEGGVREVNVARNANYFEIIIPNYNDIQFKEHFRMSRATFQNLINMIGMNYVQRNAIIPLEKKLLFTLWLLSRQESFLAVSDRFGISDGTGHYIFKETTSLLANLLPQYVKWPNAEEKNLSARVFEERSGGFPGIIGAIDGTHIPIKQPPHNAHDYYNRYGGHSILLQGTCDQNMKFIDIFVGMPGRMHDARVFRNSPLGQELFRDQDQNRLLQRNHHLGDSAYPNLINLLTPYRDNGNLHRRQINYNTKLSSVRSTIERAFGLLKGKFRRLKYLDCSDLNLANSIITSCCILQNFLIDNNDVDINIEIVEEENNDYVVVGDGGGNRNTAAMKRDEICNLIM